MELLNIRAVKDLKKPKFAEKLSSEDAQRLYKALKRTVMGLERNLLHRYLPIVARFSQIMELLQELAQELPFKQVPFSDYIELIEHVKYEVFKPNELPEDDP